MFRNGFCLFTLVALMVPGTSLADARGGPRARVTSRAQASSPQRSLARPSGTRRASASRARWAATPIYERTHAPHLLLGSNAERATRQEKLEVVRNNLDAVVGAFQYHADPRSVSDALFKLNYIGDVISRGTRIRQVGYGDRHSLRTALNVVRERIAHNARQVYMFDASNPDGMGNRLSQQGSYTSPWFTQWNDRHATETNGLEKVERVLTGMMEHRTVRALTQLARSPRR